MDFNVNITCILFGILLNVLAYSKYLSCMQIMELDCEEECGNSVSMARESVAYTCMCAPLYRVQMCTPRVACIGTRVCTITGVYKYF